MQVKFSDGSTSKELATIEQAELYIQNVLAGDRAIESATLIDKGKVKAVYTVDDFML